MHRRRKVDEKLCVTSLLCDPGWYVQRTCKSTANGKKTHSQDSLDYFFPEESLVTSKVLVLSSRTHRGTEHIFFILCIFNFTVLQNNLRRC